MRLKPRPSFLQFFLPTTATPHSRFIRVNSISRQSPDVPQWLTFREDLLHSHTHTHTSWINSGPRVGTLQAWLSPSGCDTPVCGQVAEAHGKRSPTKCDSSMKKKNLAAEPIRQADGSMNRKKPHIAVKWQTQTGSANKKSDFRHHKMRWSCLGRKTCFWTLFSFTLPC